MITLSVCHETSRRLSAHAFRAAEAEVKLVCVCVRYIVAATVSSYGVRARKEDEQDMLKGGEDEEQITSNQKRQTFLISHSELVHTNAPKYTGLKTLRAATGVCSFPPHSAFPRPFGMARYGGGLIAHFLSNSLQSREGECCKRYCTAHCGAFPSPTPMSTQRLVNKPFTKCADLTAVYSLLHLNDKHYNSIIAKYNSTVGNHDT